MKLLIISLFISTLCFGQKDSLDIKTISIRELEGYLLRINTVAMKQFDLTEKVKHENILKEIQAIYAEADKKRKEK